MHRKTVFYIETDPRAWCTHLIIAGRCIINNRLINFPRVGWTFLFKVKSSIFVICVMSSCEIANCFFLSGYMTVICDVLFANVLPLLVMMSWHGYAFRITGPLWWESTDDVSFDATLNELLNMQSSCRFERSWRLYDANVRCHQRQ